MSDNSTRENLKDLEIPSTSSIPFSPISPPISESHCKVTVIKSGEIYIPTNLILDIENEENTKLPVFTFLIEHKPTDRRIVFDLGIKSNLEEYAPSIQPLFKKWPTIPPPRELAETVSKIDSGASTIEAVILSHTHWDHTGNINAFPSSTKLIIGPGTKAARLPGYPINPDSDLVDADLPIHVREVEELGPNDTTWVDIGAFKGMDYFGDGSFYILDAPGHMVGHLSGLVRTSTSPPTYLLLAGDAAHNRALYSCCTNHSHPPCKVALFPNPRALDGLTSMHVDLKLAYESMAKMGRMEEEDGICVFLAHDAEWEKVIDDEVAREGLGRSEWEYRDVTEWYERGFKARVEAARFFK